MRNGSPTIANSLGFFALAISPPQATVWFSMPGYRVDEDSWRARLGVDASLNVKQLNLSAQWLHGQDPRRLWGPDLAEDIAKEQGLTLDLVGFELESDEFVAGYGIDCAERFRELGAIHAVELTE